MHNRKRRSSLKIFFYIEITLYWIAIFCIEISNLEPVFLIGIFTKKSKKETKRHYSFQERIFLFIFLWSLIKYSYFNSNRPSVKCMVLIVKLYNSQTNKTFFYCMQLIITLFLVFLFYILFLINWSFCSFF